MDSDLATRLLEIATDPLKLHRACKDGFYSLQLHNAFVLPYLMLRFELDSGIVSKDQIDLTVKFGNRMSLLPAVKSNADKPLAY